MAVQDDHMIRNIQDVGRLIAKLLLHEQQPNYKLPEKEADYTEADRLFATIMKLAEEGKINEAENELYMGMVEDDVDYLELALTFYLYLNDMDGDFLDDNGYSREEVLEGFRLGCYRIRGFLRERKKHSICAENRHWKRFRMVNYMILMIW